MAEGNGDDKRNKAIKKIVQKACGESARSNSKQAMTDYNEDFCKIAVCQLMEKIAQVDKQNHII